MTNPTDEERPDDTGETGLGSAGYSTDSGGDVESRPGGDSAFSAAKRSGGDVESPPPSGPVDDGTESGDSGGDVEGGPGQPA
jgi:hypothetical protein